MAIEDVRKKYRRMSILVHPDKNPDNADRAQAAFDAVKKAYALLDDVHTRKSCEEIVEEAEGRTLKNMEEKRKKLVNNYLFLIFTFTLSFSFPLDTNH